MRATTAQQDVALALKDRTGWFRVRIKDFGGSFVNFFSLNGYNWQLACTIRDSIDAVGMTATVQLVLEHDEQSISPLRTDSPLNLNGGSFEPLIDIGREIEIKTGTMGPGQEPAGFAGDWIDQFYGKIVDWKMSSDTLTLTCQDFSADLVQTFIEDQKVYGSAAGVLSETVMQSILTDNGFGAVSLYTPTPSAFALLEYVQQKMPVMEALRVIAQQIGFQVRYRWDNGTSAFRLTYYEPDRAKVVPDYTFGPDDYDDLGTLAVKAGGIRNKIRVVYGKSDARTTSEYNDAASQAKYGVRFMELIESSSSQIDTSTEADRFGNAALNDLKEPDIVASVPVPFFWPVQLEDLLRFEPDDDRVNTNQDLAVVGYEHRFDAQTSQTTFNLRGQPAGGYMTWLEIEARGPDKNTADFTGPADGYTNLITPYTMMNAYGIGSFHRNNESERRSLLLNPEFSHQSRVITGASGWPPDGWSMGAGTTWGPTGDIYVDPTNVLIGYQSLHFRSTATSPQIVESYLFPVSGGELYSVSAVFQTDTFDSANRFKAEIIYLQADRSTVVSTYVVFNAYFAGGFWVTTSLDHSLAPAGARFAFLRLTKTSNSTHNIYIDGVRVFRGRAYCRAYLTSPYGVPGGGWSKVPFTATTFDNMNGFNLGTNEYDTQSAGFYLIVGQSWWEEHDKDVLVHQRLMTRVGGIPVPMAYQSGFVKVEDDGLWINCSRHTFGATWTGAPIPDPFWLEVSHNKGGTQYLGIGPGDTFLEVFQVEPLNN